MAHMTQFSTRPFIIRGRKTCRAHLLVESPACFVNIPFEALEAEAIAAVEFVVVVLAAAVEPAREEAAGSKMANELENSRKIIMKSWVKLFYQKSHSRKSVLIRTVSAVQSRKIN